MQIDKNFKNFLEDSFEYRKEFRPVFVDYFISLCLSYDKFYSKEILEKIANLVYEDLFNEDTFIATLEEDIFHDMKKDGLMIDFLINRSMFFLLENYLKSKSVNIHNNIEILVLRITQYIGEFEKHICDKIKIQPLHINFDTTENFSVGNNILDIFKGIKNRGEDITFFNLYKGIPIKHSGIIVDMDENEVSFKTMLTQEIAMKMDGKAYILADDNFDKPIKADISYSNFSNNTIVLNNFTYLLNMPATKREYVRVHPDIMAEVSLSNEKELVTVGKLFDLSIDGLGVISEENNGIYAGAKIDLKFILDIENTNESHTISVNGEVLNIIEYSSSYRYCIKIYPKVVMEEKIINYVKLREVEILDSLEKEANSYMV